MSAVLASILVLFAVLLADGRVRRRLIRLSGPAGHPVSGVPGARRVQRSIGLGWLAGGVGVGAAGGATAGAHATGRSAGPRSLPVLGAAVLAGAGTAVLIGPGAGWVGGPVLAVATFLVLRKAEPAAVRSRRLRMEEDLPMTIDVFAACLAAGASPERALRAIAAAGEGPLVERLAVVADRLRAGADPRDAWSSLASEPGVAGLGFFERAMIRAADSGIPLVAVLDRLADDVRAERRAAADRRARSVGVRAAAPLGLCFLPAFVLVSVVPMVAVSLRGVL